MCIKVQMLRTLVEQRLNAVVEEIVQLFESTIAEYEGELSRIKEEKERQRELLDDVIKPPIADILQVLAGSQEEVLSEQQEWSASVGQVEPEPLHIKQEEEEPWGKPQGLEEADITNLTFTGVPMKNEDDEDNEGQSSPLHGSQSKENGGTEHPNQHMTTDDGDDIMSHSSETDLSDEDKEQPLESNKDLKRERRPHSDNNHFYCSECGKSFEKRASLNRHVRTHTGEKPFACSVCTKRFSSKDHLKRHMMIHTGVNPFSCSVCAKGFRDKYDMILHMRTHTGEKPFTCCVCRKRFSRKDDMTTHMRSHMEEKQFTCSLCPKRFTSKKYIMIHMRTHTGEKPFSCNVCDKRFTYKYQVSRHKCATVMEAGGT
ncbi:oocyte zinc finger protein XlCOF6.1-like [Dunckerocampus dactyliophorus]|uniref:oocyte zinc finger protein XlCOF6.1-like n=1 Tax=Dunckerocampus dactyliophorus TaxID=161453 RepID=UPI0024073F40|nr:oocyte zinc finger protein XlCOF6.1-like [Dunckerocampus dactyliophorus]